MRRRLRRAVREMCPPVIVRWYRRRTASFAWSGDFPTWEEAASECSGYQQANILERVRDATRQVKAGRGAFERDSVVFQTPEFNWPLLSVLLEAAAANGGKLRVLDFGGSLGSLYHQHRHWLAKLADLCWTVVEQEHFVRCGREHFEDGRLRFHDSIADALAEGAPDVALLSGVLGYLPEPDEILSALADTGVRYLVVDRTGFTHDDADRITVQRVPPEIYEASYPCRFFSRSRLVQSLARDFELITTFPSVDASPPMVEFLGLVFRRREVDVVGPRAAAAAAASRKRNRNGAEHFVTCFDHRFLLQGMALHESLLQQHPRARLWVVCLDEQVERQLERLRLPKVTLLPLREIETPELLEAKSNRSWPEYIYTLTPFLFQAVLDRDAAARRVTYLDADLYFFRSIETLFEELDDTAEKIFITEHGFSPDLNWLAAEFGRFCVQFVTVPRAKGCLEVVRHWQQQCLASCSTAVATRASVFGEQKYLDEWPERYPDRLQICSRATETLAPWNVDHAQTSAGTRYWPVFYHFHSLRIFRRGWVQLHANFRLRHARHLYDRYLSALRRQDARLAASGVPQPIVPFRNDRWWLTRLAWRCAVGRARVRRFTARR